MRLSTNETHLLVACLLAAACFVGCPPPPPTVYGEIRTQRVADTLTLEYELMPDGKGARIDSVAISIEQSGNTTGGDSLLFSSRKNVSDQYSARDADLYKDAPFLKGRLTYINVDTTASQYQILLHTSGGYWSRNGEPHIEAGHLRIPDGYGLLFELGYANLDRLRARDQAFESHNLHGVDLSFGGLTYADKLTGTLIAAIKTGHSEIHDRTVMELSIGARYQYGGRDRMWPSPSVAAVLHGVRTSRGPDTLTTGAWGVSAGLVVETKCERFTYTYNTYLGGFHKGEALFTFLSSSRTKLGTLYSFSSGDDIREFRMSLHLEGMTSPGSPMVYINRRTVLQNTLSAGFFAPIYLFVKVCGLL